MKEDNMKKYLGKLTKRKFAFPFITACTFGALDILGLGLSFETMLFITVMVGTFVLPEAVADTMAMFKGKKKK